MAYLASGAAPLITNMIYYLGLGLFALAFLVIAFFVLYMTSYKYKITYWEVVGNASKGLTVDQPRKNRARWNKDKTAWQLMYPLFRGKEVEPFNAEHIYPGKSCYAFKFGEALVPAKISVSDKEEGIITPIPYHIRNWQKLELKQNELEFAKTGFWENNKAFFMTIICVALCVGLAGVTVYYTYQFATGGRDSMNALTQAINSIATYGGRPPA